ncbi:MAG: T9SS type A sorting domain-containing protein [Fibrobacteres bacterium]|nr:T9SS type A sorting domain-containing protein [Fibrobacterota bacterium]
MVKTPTSTGSVHRLAPLFSEQKRGEVFLVISAIVIILSTLAGAAPSQYKIKKLPAGVDIVIDGDHKEWTEEYFIDSLHSDDNVTARSVSIPPWTPSWFQYKVYLGFSDNDTGWIYGLCYVTSDTDYIVRTTGWAGSADNMRLNYGGPSMGYSFYVCSDGSLWTYSAHSIFFQNSNMFGKCKTYGNRQDSLPVYEFKFKKTIVCRDNTIKSFKFSFGTEEITMSDSTEIGIFAAIGIEYIGDKQAWSSNPWDNNTYYPTFTLIDSTDASSERNVLSHSKSAMLLASPNPFMSNTSIYYNAPVNGSLNVYDATGRLVYHKDVKAGIGKTLFNASSLPSGVYVARLKNGKSSIQSKLSLIR